MFQGKTILDKALADVSIQQFPGKRYRLITSFVFHLQV